MKRPCTAFNPDRERAFNLSIL